MGQIEGSKDFGTNAFGVTDRSEIANCVSTLERALPPRVSERPFGPEVVPPLASMNES